MKRTVFISHSSADKDIADRACAYLERNGVPCWIAPRDVTPGKNYGAAIVDAIDECRVFVLILSSRSNKSRQVVREVERAASSDSVILPFRIEDVMPSRELAFYVSAAHWLDAAKYNVDEQFDELLAAIQDWQKAALGSETTSEAPTVSAVIPPPLPAATPPSVAAAHLPHPPQKKSSQRWWLFAAIAAVLLLICGWVLVEFLSSSKPATKLTDVSPAPSPVTTPVASGAAAADVAVPEPAVTETAAPTTTPNESRIAASSATPIRLRPGERRRPSSPADDNSTPSLETSLPAQTRAATAPSVKKPIVREVAASSQLNDEYRPNLAFDGNPATAWVVKGRAMKQTLFAHFKEPALIESVSILNGDARDEEHYHASNRIRTLRIVLSDGSNQLLTFKDEMKIQRFPLTKAVTAEWIKFEIVSVFPGKTRKTGIAEIDFNEPESKEDNGY